MNDDKKKYYKWKKEDLERALLALKKKEMSLNRISATYSIPKPTILRHSRKRNKFANDLSIHKGRPTTFDMELENILVKHILDLEKNLFGLTITDVRKLAFALAETQNIAHKFNKTRKMAGKAWFYAFKARHPELSVRQPESTSINRIKGFNRHNVYGFYDLLEKIIDENGLTAVSIFNVDEGGFSTVQKKPQKIIGLKGKKQVGAITSAERGVNTTAVCCASAAGQFVPPMLIFKRMRQNPELGNGKPEGSVVTISESGYINSVLFVEWIKHFVSVVKPSATNKVLLLLDGHTTHSKNLGALTLAKDNGIIMVQLPGHTTHRLQPLDVSFFKPISTFYIQAIEKWLRTNPGRQVTQYQVASLFAEAYGRAAVIGTICNGFKASGVWPVNRNVFPEHLFEAADNMDADSSKTLSNESISILQDSTILIENNNQEKGHINKTEKVFERTEDIFTKGKENSPVSPSVNQQPSTSGLQSKNIRKSLNSLWPIPKNKQHKKNTIQKAVEITSSPYKNKLEESVAAKRYKTTGKSKKTLGTTSNIKLINKEKSQNIKNEKGKKKIIKTQIRNRSSSTSSDDVVLEKVKKTSDNAGKTKAIKKGQSQNDRNSILVLKKKKIRKTQKRQRSSSTSSDDCGDVVLELSDDDDNDDDEENVCAICEIHYFDKTGPNVDWLQCVRCHRWVHETCTLNPDICDNCLN